MEFNEYNIKKIRGLIIFTVAAVVIGVNYQKILGIAGTLFGFAFPFLLGAVIAFLLNIPMRKIEKLLNMREKSKLRRPLSLVITLFAVAGVLFLVILVVVPQLLETFIKLQSTVPAFLLVIKNEAERLFAANPGILEAINSVEVDWKSIMQQTAEFLTTGATTVFGTTFSAAMSLVNGVTTFAIAFIFSLYILLQKEALGRQFGKLLRAFLPDSVMEKTVAIAGLTSRTFSSFFTGQCVEAVILGTMFFIALNIFRLPYALLIGVLIAFTALIPVFGAFIGCAVGIFLMLVENPVDALIFTVLFFVLQQIEGNLIYPHVVGGSVGLPSIWVLMAVTIGGSAMGIVGMLVFIPLCSVLYSLLRGVVNERLREKRGNGPDRGNPLKKAETVLPGAVRQETVVRKDNQIKKDASGRKRR